ncbi:hypothetical protein FRX31_033612 [Thalictrum thalictroides]|uniref:Uncharacterized protein n=1 Tax=Thalictrum thalictroides TaxID=46969 RepID=A0A7J6UWD5_THATH|nr:hypothetical protein FRX31_033612 [Thalictrum thalictroides]
MMAEEQITDVVIVQSNVLMLTDGQEKDILLTDEMLAIETVQLQDPPADPPEVTNIAVTSEKALVHEESIVVSSPKLVVQEAQAIKLRLSQLEANRQLQGRDTAKTPTTKSKKSKTVENDPGPPNTRARKSVR